MNRIENATAEQKRQPTIEQGENSSRVFSGEINKSQTTIELYGQSAEYLANIIKQKLVPGQEYKLADFGCYGGELLQNILELLPDYKFHTVGIDREKNLASNKSAQEKIAADLEKIPLADKSVDVALVRYVLQWNDAEKQKKILKETSRIIRNFALIQHVGSDSEDTKEWRARTNDLLSGKIAKLERSGHFFSSRDEIETWMNEQGILFDRVQDRRVDEFSNLFCERYNLSDEERVKAEEILSNKNYAIQTSWLIHPAKDKMPIVEDKK